MHLFLLTKTKGGKFECFIKTIVDAKRRIQIGSRVNFRLVHCDLFAVNETYFRITEIPLPEIKLLRNWKWIKISLDSFKINKVFNLKEIYSKVFEWICSEKKIDMGKGLKTSEWWRDNDENYTAQWQKSETPSRKWLVTSVHRDCSNFTNLSSERAKIAWVNSFCECDNFWSGAAFHLIYVTRRSTTLIHHFDHFMHLKALRRFNCLGDHFAKPII